MRSHQCSCQISPLHSYQAFLADKLSLDPIEPRSGMTLDSDVERAMDKLESIRRIELLLPGIDCSACGAPTCRALAQDIVLDKGSISQCPYMDLMALDKGQIRSSEAIDHAENVWTGRIKH